MCHLLNLKTSLDTVYDLIDSGVCPIGHSWLARIYYHLEREHQVVFNNWFRS